MQRSRKKQKLDLPSQQEHIEMVLDPRVISESPRQLSNQIVGSRWLRVKRQDVEGTWRYQIDSNFDELVDLENTMIYQKLRIVGVDDDGEIRQIPKPTITRTPVKDENGQNTLDNTGSVVMKTSITGETVTGCALLGLAMFKNVNVEVNGTKLSEESRGHLPWTVYTRALLENSTTDSQHALKSALFLPDTYGEQLKEDGTYNTNALIASNKMLLERFTPSASSRPFELYTPITMIEALNFQNKIRALPSGIRLLISFEEADSSLILTSNTPGKKYKVEVVVMEIDVRLLKMSPSSVSGYELSLGKSAFLARYSIFDVEYSYISAGETRVRKTFTGALPPFVHVVMLTQEQYHGSYATQLHYFHHFNVWSLTVDYSDGSEPLSIEYDWEQRLPNRAYWFHCHFETGLPSRGIPAGTSFLNHESFRQGIIVSGGSGCGKSTFLSQLIRSPLILKRFSKIIIFYQILSPDLTELLTHVPSLELKQGLPTEEDMDCSPAEPSLFILEDAMSEIRNSKTVCQLLTRVSSHRSVSVCITVQNLFDKGELRTLTLSATHLILFRSVRDASVLKTLNSQMMWKKNFLSSAMMDCNTTDCYTPLIINLSPQWEERCRVYSGLLPGQSLTVYCSD